MGSNFNIYWVGPTSRLDVRKKLLVSPRNIKLFEGKAGGGGVAHQLAASDS